MNDKRFFMGASLLGICILLLLAITATTNVTAESNLTPVEKLGQLIFFDETLSINENQSCASCHAPEAGWSGPHTHINEAGAVYEGSIAGSFGDRRPPTAAYATQSPILHYVIEKKEPLFIGGNFWDGRATGEYLGNPAADQALGPFLNPVEQALHEAGDVVTRVCEGLYAQQFKDIWGEEACEPDNVEMAYGYIGLSIAAYEASPEVNAFTSKHDYTFQGRAKLTKQEQRGYALFRGKGKCHGCHTSNGQEALFTDYTYDNLGIPRNPQNPVYEARGYDWIDEGLGAFLATRPDYAQFAADNLGKHKVPTLRNVGLGSCEADPDDPDCIVKAYGHNGYFKSLYGIVHFYNTRDVLPTCPNPFTTEAEALNMNCWPEPEVMANVNTDELGDLGLTLEEEQAIVAFLLALSDGYTPTR